MSSVWNKSMLDMLICLRVHYTNESDWSSIGPRQKSIVKPLKVSLNFVEYDFFCFFLFPIEVRMGIRSLITLSRNKVPF